jgi:hypothetical protein
VTVWEPDDEPQGPMPWLMPAVVAALGALLAMAGALLAWIVTGVAWL